MGYYSEMAVVMFEKDFKEMEHQFRLRDDNEALDAIWCIENANDYSTDEWQKWTYNNQLGKAVNIGHVHKVIILHWHWIKSYGTGMKAIRQYIEHNGGAIARVGEEMTDVDMEQFDHKTEEAVEWYDYIEPVSWVEIKGSNKTETYSTFQNYRDNKPEEKRK